MKKSIDRHEVLKPNHVYHVYNKAISNDKLFLSHKDFHLFLNKLHKFICPVCRVLCYCLIPNHFHLLVEIKDADEIEDSLIRLKKTPEKTVGQQFSNFFNSYSRSFNIMHERLGRLFLYPYNRIHVENTDYLTYLICYIHHNPIHHGLSMTYEGWKYSSYQQILSENNNLVTSEMVISIFGSKNDFIEAHKEMSMLRGFGKFLLEGPFRSAT